MKARAPVIAKVDEMCFIQTWIQVVLCVLNKFFVVGKRTLLARRKHHNHQPIHGNIYRQKISTVVSDGIGRHDVFGFKKTVRFHSFPYFRRLKKGNESHLPMVVRSRFSNAVA